MLHWSFLNILSREIECEVYCAINGKTNKVEGEIFVVHKLPSGHYKDENETNENFSCLIFVRGLKRGKFNATNIEQKKIF